MAIWILAGKFRGVSPLTSGHFRKGDKID